MVIKPINKRQRMLCRFIATIFITSRLWTALFVYLGQMQRSFLAPIQGGWTGVPNWGLNAWTTFDSQYFLHIALHGYTSKTSPFFPLYPLLLKLAGNNAIVMAAWGILLSNLALLVGLYYLYRLTRLDFHGRVARIAVVIIAFFPTTAFFSAVYTESLFLLLIVATFYCVRRNRWMAAALWAGLASLTRNSGPIIAIMLGVEYWQVRKRKEPLSRFAWLSALTPCVTFIAFQGYIALRLGGALSGVRSQNSFARHVSWPWTPLLLDLKYLFPQGQFHPDTLLGILVSLLVFVLVIRHWKRFPKSYSIFMLGINLANLCYSRAFWPFTASAVRYQMTTFPFSQMLAKDAQSMWNRRWSKLIFLGCYLAICAVMCWLFGKKSFIG